VNAPRKITIALVLGLALPLFSCGSDSGRSSPPLREAVLRGAARDFAEGTGIGGRAFETCVLGRLRTALDRPTLDRLVQVYRRPGGQPFAAQALNQLAAPLAARCGHRTYVPELVEASRGLRGASAAGPGAKRLGVTYGPYLGVRCRRANHVGCDRVGIDVVLAAPASSVTAVVAHRRLRLRTPGLHSGARYRDWVGTFERAGLQRASSPFHVDGYGPAQAIWAGSPAVYVPLRLQVAFRDSRRAGAKFPAVFLSPGWG
jgi:hypothetical protein